MQARNSGTRLTSMDRVGPNYRLPTRCDKSRSAHRDLERDGLRLDIRRNISHGECHTIAPRRQPTGLDDEALRYRTAPFDVAIEFEHDRRRAADQPPHHAGDRRESVARVVVGAIAAAVRQTVDLGVGREWPTSREHQIGGHAGERGFPVDETVAWSERKAREPEHRPSEARQPQLLPHTADLRPRVDVEPEVVEA